MRFLTQFDTLSWTETELSLSLSSPPHPSSAQTPQPRLTTVRTERTFHAPPPPAAAQEKQGTFEGAGVTHYILSYAPSKTEEEGGQGDAHSLKAAYTGVTFLSGTWRDEQGEREWRGWLTLRVEKGRFEGKAQAEWSVVDAELVDGKGGKVGVKKEEGKGGYVSQGMKDSEAWIELELDE